MIFKNNAYFITLNVNHTPVKFKVDTGSAVTLVPYSVCKTLGVKLSHTNAMFIAVNGVSVNPKGVFVQELKCNNIVVKADIYVLEKETVPLLGINEIISLNLFSSNAIDTLCSTVSNTEQLRKIEQQYPLLFRGLGEMHDEYRITLKPDAVPYALTRARKVAIPLKNLVKETLDNMVQHKVIHPVYEPRDWQSPMVTVLKPDGTVRVCGDYTKLNQAIKRENYHLPDVDYLLSKLGDAKCFTKLDLSCAYHQLPLSEESKKYTCFITPWGRFEYDRMPFGICSASEKFQRSIVDNILLGIEDKDKVHAIQDDIIVATATVEENIKVVHQVLKVLSDAGVTLKKEKCQFFKTEVPFVGHIISAEGIKPDTSKQDALRRMPPPSDVKTLRSFIVFVNILPSSFRISLQPDYTVFASSNYRSQATYFSKEQLLRSAACSITLFFSSLAQQTRWQFKYSV